MEAALPKRRSPAHAGVEKQTVSNQRIQQFHHFVAKGFRGEGEVLLNLVDALTVGPRPVSAVETTLSPAWNFNFCNFYVALKRSGKRLADNICDNYWLQDFRRARLEWLNAEERVPPNMATGKWQVLILDASDYPRPKMETVRIRLVHSAEGLKKGDGLSIFSERVGEGICTLALKIGWIPPDSPPITYGAAQIEEFIKRAGWKQTQVLVADARHTVEPFLETVNQLKVPILGRVAGSRTFYKPRDECRGIGLPRVRGHKIQLNDDQTLPAEYIRAEWQTGRNTRFDVRLWDDVRVRQWSDKSLSIYRVIEYRADRQPRFKPPLWLLFVAGGPGGDQPSPREAQSI